MSFLLFTQTTLTAALARGVRQCVVIGSRGLLSEFCLSYSDHDCQVFLVDEEPSSNSPATFVPTQFASETLATALAKSSFNAQKASLFVWLGDAGYRTVDAALASIAFMASLPRESGVVLDYVVERTSPGSLIHTALDALASRLEMVGGSIKHLIDPPAVAAMLRGLGFQKIVDRAPEERSISGRHLVSAVT
jgi:O-methyltransferase involved in polyketide biosynthesis